jgi:methylated-DNA-protein-cysteine methyltransferase-like protein
MKANESFFASVYAVVEKIPFGRVTTYGAIAAYLGTKSSSRMVGWALNLSHHSKSSIPAHRVVNRNGLLTGKHHFGWPGLMQHLLEQEGIKVEEDRVVRFAELFWNPATELRAEDR